MRLAIAVGAANGLLAVAMGAMAAHGLEARLPEQALQWIETGSRYGLAHGVALLVIAALARQETAPSLGLRFAAWAFVAGSILFCGTLYVMGLVNTTAPAALVPIGGVALIADWASLLVYCATRRKVSG